MKGSGFVGAGELRAFSCGACCVIGDAWYPPEGLNACIGDVCWPMLLFLGGKRVASGAGAEVAPDGYAAAVL